MIKVFHLMIQRVKTTRNKKYNSLNKVNFKFLNIKLNMNSINFTLKYYKSISSKQYKNKKRKNSINTGKY